MTGCDNGVLVLRDLSRQLLLLSFDFGPNFSIISAHIVGHSIVVLSGPCLDAGFSSIGITKCANSEQPRVCKLSMISFGGVLQHEVIENSEAFECSISLLPGCRGSQRLRPCILSRSVVFGAARVVVSCAGKCYRCLQRLQFGSIVYPSFELRGSVIPDNCSE
jgi:hypothetical protein